MFIQKDEYQFESFVYKNGGHIESLAQDCSNAIANALELLQSCAKPWYCLGHNVLKPAPLCGVYVMSEC